MPAIRIFSYLIAHAGERDGYVLALQLLDGVQHRVAAGGVDEVNRAYVHKHVLPGRWLEANAALNHSWR